MHYGRLAFASALAAGSFAGAPVAGAPAATRPSPTDFVGLPSCVLYAKGTDLRVRVRAPDAEAVCKTLVGQRPALGVHWSLHAQPLRHILSPICLMAAPRGRVELQVVDDSHSPRGGARLCAELAGSGWLDLNG